MLEAIEVLSGLPGIAQARLHGDQVRVMVKPGGWSPESLNAELTGRGISVDAVIAVEPTLEDVFMLLAHQ